MLLRVATVSLRSKRSERKSTQPLFVASSERNFSRRAPPITQGKFSQFIRSYPVATTLCKSSALQIPTIPKNTLNTHKKMNHNSSTSIPPRVNLQLNAPEITALAAKLISDSKAILDRIAAIPDDARTFENTILPLAEEELEFQTLSSNCEFPQYVSTDKEVRDASTEADKKLQEYAIETGFREDIFKALLAVQPKLGNASAETKRFVERALRDFRRNGLALPLEKRDQAKEIKKKISELCIEYQKRLNEDVSEVALSAAQLEGLPADFLSGLQKRDDGLYRVTMKYPDVLPCMKKAKIEDTRQQLELCNSSRCAENGPLLEKIIALRDELAHLLDYASHSDFVLEIRMAKSPQNVQTFFKDLKPRLDKLASKELDVLLALKKKETGDKFDGKINAWDFQYYHTMRMETEYAVNDDEVKQYFPLEKVISETLAIYQEILDVKFTRVNQTGWHSEVSLYAVHDSSGEFMGHFWMDLHPRDGKYSHAAAFPLQPSALHPLTRARQYPAAAMVANFSKATADRPSLLRHGEVVTFFHEFGHIMHNICSKVEYSRFSGTSVERDFVECPSQMLENWCWQTDVLTRLSSHFETKKPLPAELVAKLIAAKNADSGLLYLRQMFFGVFDQTVHTQHTVDTQALWAKLKKEITLVEHTPGTNPAATFGHIVGGYDASYYGYLWAEVFSADLFDQFLKKGVMSQQMGKKYRQLILFPGGSKDAADMLREFLGRDPQPDAFLKQIGLSP